MASIIELTCPLCSSAAHLKFDYREFCKHLRLFHAHQPGFRVPCRINGCQRSYTNLRSFQNHVSSVHNWAKDEGLMLVEEECLLTNGKSCDDSNDYDDDTDDSDDNDNNDDNGKNHTGSYGIFESGGHEQSDDTFEVPCYSREMLQKSSAIFLLGLKEKYKLTQTAIHGIIEGFTNVTQQQIGSLQSQVVIKLWLGRNNYFIFVTFKVYATLNKAGITISEVEGLDNCFRETSNHPFAGLETQYQQMQYFKKQLNLIVRMRDIMFVLSCCIHAW